MRLEPGMCPGSNVRNLPYNLVVSVEYIRSAYIRMHLIKGRRKMECGYFADRKRLPWLKDWCSRGETLFSKLASAEGFVSAT